MPAVKSNDELVDGALYIFTGTSTGSTGISCTNLICKALNGAMHIARYPNAAKVVTFNSETEDFEIRTGSCVGGLSLFQKQAPFLTWGPSVIITELPTKETTVGKIVPTEEVSGLNFLNSYEDELTDI